MTLDRKELARQALHEALNIRQKAGIELWDPLCVYDLAGKLGVKVRFEAISSMEGMYCPRSGPVILINSERPAGRQAFTCGHELGHHVFKHGDRIDELSLNGSRGSQVDPKEFLADCFSGFLLMPKVAVSNAFRLRGWTISTATPTQIYTVSNLFGVGYGTLIRHMQFSLGILQRLHAERLMAATPKSIREALLGSTHAGGLIIADSAWTGRPIDLSVGDRVIMHGRAEIDGTCIRTLKDDAGMTIFEAVESGHAQLQQSGTQWAAFVRVSRKAYQGMATFRHLPECSDE